MNGMNDLTDYKYWNDVDIAGNKFLIPLEPAMLTTGAIIQRSLRGGASVFPEPVLFDREFVKEKIRRLILNPLNVDNEDKMDDLLSLIKEII